MDIKLKRKAPRVLKSQGCDLLIENIIEELFSNKVKVDFIDNEVNNDFKDEYLKNKENEEVKLVNEAMLTPANKKR